MYYQVLPTKIVIGYLQFGVIANLDRLIFAALNTDYFVKAVSDPESRPEAMQIDRTTSRKNSWYGKMYCEIRIKQDEERL